MIAILTKVMAGYFLWNTIMNPMPQIEEKTEYEIIHSLIMSADNAEKKKYDFPKVLKANVPTETLEKKTKPKPYYEDVYTVTAYTNGFESTQKKKGEPGYGITASGERTEEGVTIACDRSLPFGTRVDIEGVGTRYCQDRGGAVDGKHIDLFIEDLQKAREFGRQKLSVKIYEER